MSCPPGNPGCKNQAPPPKGDGCGKDLAWWLSDAPWKPMKPKKPTKPVKPKKKRQITLADLPDACSAVLDAAPVPVSQLKNSGNDVRPSRYAGQEIDAYNPSADIRAITALPKPRPLIR